MSDVRVCVIGTRGFPDIEGGVESHCGSLYPRMGTGFEIVVFRRRPYVQGDAGVSSNIRFIDLPSTRIKGFETVFHSFLATVATLVMRPDVAHYHNIGPALFSPLLKIRHIPVVLTYHSANYEHAKWGSFAKALLRHSERVALSTADRVIFVNKQQMLKYPPEIRAKSRYIPNGAEPPRHPVGHAFLAGLGLKPGKYVLGVGRITPEKGFDILIRAFKQAKPAGYKLVIAGGVESEKGHMRELEDLACDDGVIFAGQVHGDDIAQLYANAGLFVLSSYNEGFPLVLLEAMSYGLDVVASDIPASHMVSLEDTDLFPVGDVAALSGLISQRLSCGHPARHYDLRSFDWQLIADQTSSVYLEACHRQNGDL